MAPVVRGGERDAFPVLLTLSVRRLTLPPPMIGWSGSGDRTPGGPKWHEHGRRRRVVTVHMRSRNEPGRPPLPLNQDARKRIGGPPTASAGGKARGRPAARPRPEAARESPVGSWDHVASWYDSLVGERGSEFHQAVIVPGVLRMLAIKHGERVLDLACGQGAVSLTLREAGARVTGVDLSPLLVEKARERSPADIEYLVGDARRLDVLGQRRFDGIVFILAAQNMDPIEPVIRECSRLLVPGGRLVMVVPHPAFRIPRQSGWRWDEDRKALFREVDRYLTPMKIPIDMRPFKRPSQKITWTFHRPLGAYINGLAAAGLWTNALEEWASHKVSQPGPRAAAENRARADFPLFAAIRAVRTPPA